MVEELGTVGLVGKLLETESTIMYRIASLAVDVGGDRRVNGDAWVSPGGKGRVRWAADGRVHHF